MESIKRGSENLDEALSYTEVGAEIDNIMEVKIGSFCDRQHTGSEISRLFLDVVVVVLDLHLMLLANSGWNFTRPSMGGASR